MRIFYRIFIIGLILVLGINYLFAIIFSILMKHEIDFNGILIRSIILGVIYSAVYSIGLRYNFKPKFDFLKSGLPVESKFRNIKARIPCNDEAMNFDKLIKLIELNMFVTFIDKEKQIIKFREKFKIFSWGAAAVIEMNNDNKEIIINSFPLSNNSSKIAIDLTKTVECLINKI